MIGQFASRPFENTKVKVSHSVSQSVSQSGRRLSIRACEERYPDSSRFLLLPPFRPPPHVHLLRTGVVQPIGSKVA